MKHRPLSKPSSPDYDRYGRDDETDADLDADEHGGSCADERNLWRSPNFSGKGSTRSRPTNNQLLYKAYFRWAHYPDRSRHGTSHLPSETDACASVTAAFLQVLQTLHSAEQLRMDQKRNVLQMLSTNTRRTKVVELTTGTHRVPDELKKHYLSDDAGGQYSTNLDRNRYGNDDQYLFTVIRYDLEYLRLCPCLIDVEIIDAKNNSLSVFVSAGPDACICQKGEGGCGRHEEKQKSGARQQSQPKRESPKRSQSGVSQLFDALVMAATGAEAMAEANGTDAQAQTHVKGKPEQKAAAHANGQESKPPAPTRLLHHKLPDRQKSRLWSALSYGDIDSLQNALDAFQAEDETASGQGMSDVLAENSFRKRKRKSVNPSSSLLGAVSAGGSLFKSTSGLKERSDENAKCENSGGGVKKAVVTGGERSHGDDSDQVKQGHEQDQDTASEEGCQPPPRRVRHVPRQSSAVNLTTKMGPAELKRLAAEVQQLRNENKRLQLEIRNQQGKSSAAADEEERRIRAVEQELKMLRQELQQLSAAKHMAEEQVLKVTVERNAANNMVTKLCQLVSLQAVMPGGHGLAAAQLSGGMPNSFSFTNMPSLSAGLPLLPNTKTMSSLSALGQMNMNVLAGVAKRGTDESVLGESEPASKRAHVESGLNSHMEPFGLGKQTAAEVVSAVQ